VNWVGSNFIYYAPQKGTGTLSPCTSALTSNILYFRRDRSIFPIGGLLSDVLLYAHSYIFSRSLASYFPG
jgi:hypothetical protein